MIRLSKRSSIWCVILLAILGVVDVRPQDEENPTVDVADFAVIRREDRLIVQLGMPIDDLLEKLGSPLKTWVEPNGSDEKWDVLRYQFEGITLGVMRQWRELMYIWAYDDQYETPRGVRIGEPFHTATGAYPDAMLLESGSLYLYNELPELWHVYTMVIVRQNGGVSEIVMGIGAE